MASGIPEHTPERPGWVCRHCWEPWPCAPRRELLREEAMTDSTSTILYLANQYWFAIEDSIEFPVSGPSPLNLRTRFIGWLLPTR